MVLEVELARAAGLGVGRQRREAGQRLGFIDQVVACAAAAPLLPGAQPRELAVQSLLAAAQCVVG